MSERDPKRAVVLVGHGGVPKDYPRELVRRLKALETQRAASGAPPGSEEIELDARIRHWPRTPHTDPYQAGLETLAAALRPLLHGVPLVLAYNEFCAPTVEQAVEGLLAEGIASITIVPSMLTPGGSHSEIDIPRTLAGLRERHPRLELRYAWPVDTGLLAGMLADHLRRFA